eukprot:COSAG01_NODE_6056_length_3876_cov_9.951019_1_plen_80_part_00
MWGASAVANRSRRVGRASLRCWLLLLPCGSMRVAAAAAAAAAIKLSRPSANTFAIFIDGAGHVLDMKQLMKWCLFFRLT